MIKTYQILLALLMLTCLPIKAQNQFSEKVYYRIVNKNNGARCVDIVGEKSYEGELICLWSNIAGRQTQDWILHPVGEYWQIFSRNGGWAINDPTQGEATASTNTGAQFNLAKVDSTSASQLWKLVPQDEGYFNIINVRTDHTMNVWNGTDADGTALASYNSDPDTKNKTSKNRLWKFVESDSIYNGGDGGVDTTVVVDTGDDFKRVSNLPHVYINTVNKQAITSKKTFIQGEMYYVAENDSITHYESLEIRGRGNSTFNRTPDKLPYRIRFAEEEELLGPKYAKARNWTLMANTYDKAIMRNGLTSELTEFCGLDFAVAHKYVDVTLNGVYIGTYHISDHPEVGEKRVDIPLGGTGTDVSYFMECDGYAEHNYFNTSKKSVPIRIHYPMQLTAAQKSYATRLVNTFESKLFSDSFADPDNGYRALIDSVSLANWYCAIELCGNLDCFWSLYFYRKQGDPKIYLGPMWDYDIAYGNDSRRGDTSKSLMVDVAFELDRAGSWVNRMWEDPWFQQLINRRYAELREAGVEEFLLNKVDSLENLLTESARLNYAKYGISKQYYNERVFHGTYGEYVNDLRTWIKAHVPYLTTAFKNKKASGPTPPFEANTDYYYHIYNANTSATVAVDVKNQSTSAGSQACVWEDSESRETLNWYVIPVDDYFQIITYDGKGALYDSSTASPTSTTTTILTLAAINNTDSRQLWNLVPQGTAGFYNVINKQTGRTMNLNGGYTSNGNSVISYSTDTEKNKTGTNRLWKFELTSKNVPETTKEAVGINEIKAVGMKAEAIYTIDGVKHTTLQPGLNIIKNGNSVNKVFVK